MGGGEEEGAKAEIFAIASNHQPPSLPRPHVPAIYVAASISGGLIVFLSFFPLLHCRARALTNVDFANGCVRVRRAACLPAFCPSCLPAFCLTLSLGAIAAAALALGKCGRKSASRVDARAHHSTSTFEFKVLLRRTLGAATTTTTISAGARHVKT